MKKDEIELGPAERKSLEYARQNAQIELAKELFVRGARLQVAESLTSAKKLTLKNIYRETLGKVPPRGSAPFEFRTLLKSDVYIQTSLFLNFLKQAKDDFPQADDAEILIKAYDGFYRIVVGTVISREATEKLQLEITKARLAMVFYLRGDLILKVCNSCKTPMAAEAIYTTRKGLFTCSCCVNTRGNVRKMKRPKFSEIYKTKYPTI